MNLGGCCGPAGAAAHRYHITVILKIAALRDWGLLHRWLMSELGQTRPSWPRLHVHSCPQSPPIAAVNDPAPLPATQLAPEAATVGPPFASGRLRVRALPVFVLARPPNTQRRHRFP